MSIRGHGTKLPRKRQQAIAALLECGTVKEAAKSVGIGHATMFRWLQDPEFQDAYREAKRYVVDQAISRIQQVACEAVRILQEIMNDEQKPAGARVSAARIVLETAVRGVEIQDLEERIQKLEQKMTHKEENQYAGVNR